MPTGSLALDAFNREYELAYDDLTRAEETEIDAEATNNTVIDPDAIQAAAGITTFAATNGTTAGTVTIGANGITMGGAAATTYTIHNGNNTVTTIGDPYVYRNDTAYDPWTITTAPGITYTPYSYGYVTQSDLERFFKRIYKVIADHTTINVTEDEFLKMIQEEEKDG